ncbi:hypothetical protein FGSG_10263 [Fusarium graminearum PH-1]|uniref:Chromosome 1, complete genome n=2 Tax=Gibberella zeae TaxID=5518 RepID=I1S0N0_GIBZE|nr:hypothetical protein FGSG_10263 [Fusarium graminearum PH-1]EYB28777.1 hypothetical protein FG05_10263 [Fusarium graminearum]ESU16954.1 hypothetical protein FGSG_10263 [Fusarium graminearum PH-1]CAF3517606.1 unnamed protein product [Fusarium graminearum]CAF3561562.1 unnamed protein product [Fusarium graminearum]CAG1998155.1 unnamed protein product [Fusarium graminearum]|eukprot:XP_011319216.1 hypothetical protein FGSG_10263 [Fusarium graminearum PH-1]
MGVARNVESAIIASGRKRPPQHLIHNICSIIWEQFIQEKVADQMSHKEFRDMDALIVKVGCQMDLFPQVGETCTVTIANAVFEPRSAPVDQTPAFETFFQLLLKSFSRKKHPSDDDEHVDEDSKKSFRGSVRDVTDRNIPPEYRVIAIRHPRGFNVYLPYVELNGSESLADYLSRVEDEDLKNITLKTGVSNKTLEAQSLTMNYLKYSLSAKPYRPSVQSQEAYKYLLNLDRSINHLYIHSLHF